MGGQRTPCCSLASCLGHLFEDMCGLEVWSAGTELSSCTQAETVAVCWCHHTIIFWGLWFIKSVEQKPLPVLELTCHFLHVCTKNILNGNTVIKSGSH